MLQRRVTAGQGASVLARFALAPRVVSGPATFSGEMFCHLRRQFALLLIGLAVALLSACAGSSSGTDADALPQIIDVASDPAPDVAPTTFELLTPGSSPDEPAAPEEAEPVAEPAAPAFDTSGPGAGQPVVLGRSTDPSAALHPQLLQKLLIEFGYDASNPADQEHDTETAYQLLAAGEIDVWADTRLPADRQFWDDVNLVLVDAGLVPDGAIQGYLVTKSWAVENGIRTLNDINFDPLLANQLDRDGNGIGDIVGCATGEACEPVINGQILSSGWTNLERLSVELSDPFVDFLARAAAGQPAIAYATAPSAQVGAARVGDLTMWLSVTPGAAVDASAASSSLGSSVCLQTETGCFTGFPGGDISVTLNAEWLAENPLAERYLRQLQPQLGAINEGLVAIEAAGGGQDEIERVAQEWIDANRTQIEIWTDRALGPDPLPPTLELNAEDLALADALVPLFGNSNLGTNADPLCYTRGIVRALEGAVPMQFNFGITAATVSRDTVLLVSLAEAFHIADELIGCGALTAYEQRIASDDSITDEEAACAFDALEPLAGQAAIAANFIAGDDATWINTFAQNAVVQELRACGAEL